MSHCCVRAGLKINNKKYSEEITSERESTAAHIILLNISERERERARYLFALYVDFKYLYAAILKYSSMQGILNIQECILTPVHVILQVCFSMF